MPTYYVIEICRYLQQWYCWCSPDNLSWFFSILYFWNFECMWLRNTQKHIEIYSNNNTKEAKQTIIRVFDLNNFHEYYFFCMEIALSPHSSSNIWKNQNPFRWRNIQNYRLRPSMLCCETYQRLSIAYYCTRITLYLLFVRLTSNRESTAKLSVDWNFVRSFVRVYVYFSAIFCFSNKR